MASCLRRSMYMLSTTHLFPSSWHSLHERRPILHCPPPRLSIHSYKKHQTTSLLVLWLSATDFACSAPSIGKFIWTRSKTFSRGMRKDHPTRRCSRPSLLQTGYRSKSRG